MSASPQSEIGNRKRRVGGSSARAACLLGLGLAAALVACRDRQSNSANQYAEETGSGQSSSPPAAIPSPPAPATSASMAASSPGSPLPAAPLSPGSTNAPAVMEINHAVMVTVDLDFGSDIPPVAEALLEIERRSQPEDQRGRTFAILDAYGEPTPEGKLRVSMHVSTEKPGSGALVFRRTGQVLWQSRIIRGTNSAAFTGRNLLILIDDGSGKTFTVDGSGGPSSILEARIKEKGVLVTEFWPDEAEREVTFLYSACGCPVKVKVRRLGDRTARTSDLPVIFPDDPAAVALITHLMRW